MLIFNAFNVIAYMINNKLSFYESKIFLDLLKIF